MLFAIGFLQLAFQVFDLALQRVGLHFEFGHPFALILDRRFLDVRRFALICQACFKRAHAALQIAVAPFHLRMTGIDPGIKLLRRFAVIGASSHNRRTCSGDCSCCGSGGQQFLLAVRFDIFKLGA